MAHLSELNINALEASATSAAAYIDACDNGARNFRLDPAYYQACGNLLFKIFSVVDANSHFPSLLRESNAAREVLEAIQVGRRIEISRTGFYPELAVVLQRVAV
jgi:hypothetical protein